MKIAVYCSSSADSKPSWYAIGEDFGRMLARRGHGLVYGGYNQGIMAAVARGVAQEGGEIIAVVPKIFDRPGFTFDQCTRVIHTEDMSERKAVMEAQSDAFAILPGGIGTFDEFFEAYVLKSLGLLDKPIALLNVEGCYDLLAAFLDANTSDKLLTEENRRLVDFYTDGASLLDALESTHPRV